LDACLSPNSPTDSAEEAKKTTETAYLTVEHVRLAAGAWFEAHCLPRSARLRRYQQAAERIAYHQLRNMEARRSHTKTTLRRLHRMNIWLSHLPSCMPRTG
jgi:hypothetical protein